MTVYHFSFVASLPEGTAPKSVVEALRWALQSRLAQLQDDAKLNERWANDEKIVDGILDTLQHADAESIIKPIS